MKLSVSNIGWTAQQDAAVYEWMAKRGFTGLEIAPTRIFPEAPYDHLDEAARWAEALKSRWGFSVSSMQSIWYGRQERIFGTEQERKLLLNYTKKAMEFAQATGCGNLVFGCPRNRSIPEGTPAAQAESISLDFFRELGSYAVACGTVLSMEANPPIYNTNYINDTLSALALVKEADSAGFRLNLDVGTMLQNGESVDLLKAQVQFIHHVHISEPGLKPIVRRELHTQLLSALQREDYSGFVSIEMGKREGLSPLEDAIAYLGEWL